MIFFLVVVAIFFVGIWALVDAIIRPRSAFDAAMKSKTLWLVLLIVAIPLTGLISGIFGIIYLTRVRPRVKAATSTAPMSKLRWILVVVWSILVVASTAILLGSAQKTYSVGVTASDTGGNGGADPNLWWWLLASLAALVISLSGLIVVLTRRKDHPSGGQIAESGWYPDYADPSGLRYFDGTNWTGHTAPS